MPRLIYYGFWFAPEREMLQAAIDKAQEFVARHGAAQALQGQCHRDRPGEPVFALRQDLVTFEEDAGAYDHRDAAGFIKLNALRLRTLGQRRKKLGL